MAPNGYLHAGAIVALADTCCGYGCVVHLPEGAAGFTTIELKSNHLGTARDGRVECTATPVHLGPHHPGLGRPRQPRRQRPDAGDVPLYADGADGAEPALSGRWS